MAFRRFTADHRRAFGRLESGGELLRSHEGLLNGLRDGLNALPSQATHAAKRAGHKTASRNFGLQVLIMAEWRTISRLRHLGELQMAKSGA